MKVEAGKKYILTEGIHKGIVLKALQSCDETEGEYKKSILAEDENGITKQWFPRRGGTEEYKGLEIKVKYFADIEPLKLTDKGDWCDLRSAEEIVLKQGDFSLISLGIGMILPDGYEANIVPRSSTFKNFGIIQTNSMAVIDNSYSGDNDQWFYPVLAMRDTVINKNDRICQFRITKKQPEIYFETVDKLGDVDRGGHGSSGIK